MPTKGIWSYAKNILKNNIMSKDPAAQALARKKWALPKYADLAYRTAGAKKANEARERLRKAKKKK